jgi:hypothetical protein
MDSTPWRCCMEVLQNEAQEIRLLKPGCRVVAHDAHAQLSVFRLLRPCAVHVVTQMTLTV